MTDSWRDDIYAAAAGVLVQRLHTTEKKENDSPQNSDEIGCERDIFRQESGDTGIGCGGPASLDNPDEGDLIPAE